MKPAVLDRVVRYTRKDAKISDTEKPRRLLKVNELHGETGDRRCQQR
jgi:hypothetical protein